MKLLKIALGACAVSMFCAPVFAQEGPDGYEFVKAVQKRDGNKATQLVNDHPTVIDAKDPKGDTGLIVAIRGGDATWTGFLLDKGADPNLQGAGGDTPLITAAKGSFDEAADLLITIGAKVDTANRSGETALIIAVQQRDLRLVRLLLSHNANPDRADSVAGYSARDYAGRDPRARDILKLINDKKPKAGS
jgi:uncharacterized protein